MKEHIIYLSDYLFNNDAAEAFRNALDDCRKYQRPILQLDAKRYNFISSIDYQTASIAHDDGAGDLNAKEVHVLIKDIHHLTIRGTKDQKGQSQTTITGSNHGKIQSLLPSIFWVEGCQNLLIENIIFTRAPLSMYQGEILATDADGIRIQLESDLDELAAYCMNEITSEGQLKQASLTFGFGYETRWQKINNKQFSLKDQILAQKVSAGNFLTFHQAGLTDFLLFFGWCENLTLNTLTINNSNSFCLLTERCHNITACQLRIEPAKGKYFTASRDGWKIYRCSGDVKVIKSHIEGVRMDGQNIQSNYFKVQQILSRDTLLMSCKYAPHELDDDAYLYIYDEKNQRREGFRVKKWRITETVFTDSKPREDLSASPVVQGKKNRLNYYTIQFDRSLPQWVKLNNLAVLSSWELDSYLCHSSTFHNIAGAGILVRCQNASIIDNTFTNNMNAGILIGAELMTHQESDHARNVTIINNYFNHCGFSYRYGSYGKGGVAVKSQGFNAPLNHNIAIMSNVFEDCSPGIELNDAHTIYMFNNKFQNGSDNYRINQETTKNIHIM